MKKQHQSNETVLRAQHAVMAEKAKKVWALKNYSTGVKEQGRNGGAKNARLKENERVSGRDWMTVKGRDVWKVVENRPSFDRPGGGGDCSRELSSQLVPSLTFSWKWQAHKKIERLSFFLSPLTNRLWSEQSYKGYGRQIYWMKKETLLQTMRSRSAGEGVF